MTALKWLETNNLFNNLIQRNQSAAFSSGKVRPNHETNINIIARRTGKDVNSQTVLDGIITTIMATIQRINIIGSREGSRNRRRLKANQTGKKFRVGIKSNISTSTLPSIKLRKCSSKIITSILSFISGRLATKSNQIKQLIRNGRSASLQRTFKKSFTSFSHSTRNKTRDGLIRVRNIRALNGRFNTSITHAYSIVIGSKHITLNATGGGFLTASKQFRHGATSKSRSNTASNSTKHKSPHLSGWRQIISLIT